MRIFLAQTTPFYPSSGGGDKSDRIMMMALARCGHQCRVIARIKDQTKHGHDEYIKSLERRGIIPSQVDAGVVIFSLQSVEVHVATTLDLRLYMSQQLKTFDPDIILTSTDPLNSLISDIVQFSQAKTVYLARTTMLLPFGPDSAFPSKTKTEAICRAHSVVAVSQYLANYIRQHSTIPAIHVPIQTIEPEEWPTLGNFDNAFVTMVNPCALKGITIFLTLADALPTVQFAAVPTWGTTSKDRHDLALRPNVEILDAVDDIREILRQTRVMLVPSLWSEARGRIVVESLLCGVPVLASDRGGIREAAMGAPCLLPVTPIESYQDHLDEQMIRVPEIPPQDIGPWLSALTFLTTDRNHYSSISGISRNIALAHAGGLNVSKFENLLLEISHGKP